MVGKNIRKAKFCVKQRRPQCQANLETIILTSNYNFEDWGQLFQDNVVAAAIIDRLVHHAKIFYINGSSYRLRNKLKKAIGVVSIDTGVSLSLQRPYVTDVPIPKN